MTDSNTGDTKFYVELPADKYGNTALPSAVVEARSEMKDGREMLVPVAPECVMPWSSGWYRSHFGGWVETEGPARKLTYEEHRDLAANIPQEVKERTAKGMVKLKNGETVPVFAVVSVTMSLRDLVKDSPVVLYELLMACRDSTHELFGNTGEKLKELGLIQSVDQSGHTRVDDLTRSIVLSSVEGEDFDMKLVSPLAT